MLYFVCAPIYNAYLPFQNFVIPTHETPKGSLQIEIERRKGALIIALFPFSPPSLDVSLAEATKGHNDIILILCLPLNL